MQKNNTTKIEAQGGEIITRNNYGDVAIIPKNLVKKYQAYMKAACDECIDELVASLPAMHQYAADGTVIPQGKKVKVTLPDGEQAEYSTDSVEYKNLYNSGKLANVVKDKVTGEDTYVMPSLKEVEITAEKPLWMKSVDEYKKLNPKSKVIAEYLNNGIAKGLGNTATNYPSRIDEEYESKALDYAAKQLDVNLTKSNKGKFNRVATLNSLPDKQQEILSRLPKYQPGLWTDAVEGGAKLTESDPRGILVSKVLRYLNDGNFTEREKRETMKQYKDHPVISQIEAVGKLLGPLNIPYNATIGNLYTKTQGEEDYTIGAALKGQKPKTESTMLAIGADPLNLFGLGLIDDLPKLGNIGKGLKNLVAERQFTKRNVIKEMSASDKLTDLRDGISLLNYTENPDKIYRTINKTQLEDILETGKLRTPKEAGVKGKNNFRDNIQWYKGHAASRYGDIAIEAPNKAHKIEDLIFHIPDGNGNMIAKTFNELSKERQMVGKIEDVAEEAALIAASEKELSEKISAVRNSTTLTPQQKEVTLMRLRAATEEGQKRLANYPEGALDRLFNVKLEQDFNDIAYYNPRRNAVAINPDLPRDLQRRYTRHELEHVLQGLKNTGIEDALEGRIILKPRKLLKKNTPIPVSKIVDKADQGKFKKQSVAESLITPKYNVIEELLPEAASYYRQVEFERSAMVSELQRYAMQHKYVKNEYDVMTPKLMKTMYENVKKDPKKALRIFGIIDDTKFADSNFEALSDAYNKLLGAGIIGGSITAQTLRAQLNNSKSKRKQ